MNKEATKQGDKINHLLYDEKDSEKYMATGKNAE